MPGFFELISKLGRLCCTNGLRDPLLESSVIAGNNEQLGPYEVQDHKLVGLQRAIHGTGSRERAYATGIA